MFIGAYTRSVRGSIGVNKGLIRGHLRLVLGDFVGEYYRAY